MKRALVDDRPFLIISLILAISYPLVRDAAIGEIFIMLWKAGSVAMLAFYALRRLSGLDAALLSAFLGFSALGDALIIISITLGGAAFFIAHLNGIALWLRYRRDRLAFSQRLFAVLMIVFVPFLSFLLTLPATQWPLLLYSLILAIMAACAWTSAFSRYRVGAGAILFVISDLLLFGGMGRLQNISLAEMLVWPTYYAGQLMICTGAVHFLLRHSKRA